MTNLAWLLRESRARVASGVVPTRAIQLTCEALGFTVWDRTYRAVEDAVVADLGTVKPEGDVYPVRWVGKRWPRARQLAAFDRAIAKEEGCPDVSFRT